MNDQTFNVAIETGVMVNINNPFSVPIEVTISGFGCGASVTIGLTPGQFFSLRKGSSHLTVIQRDLTGTELHHPGPILGAEDTDKMH